MANELENSKQVPNKWMPLCRKSPWVLYWKGGTSPVVLDIQKLSFWCIPAGWGMDGQIKPSAIPAEKQGFSYQGN